MTTAWSPSRETVNKPSNGLAKYRHYPAGIGTARPENWRATVDYHVAPLDLVGARHIQERWKEFR